MAINSTTTTTTTLATHPAGATALSTSEEAYAEARTTTTATPLLTPALATMLPTLVRQGTQGSAAPSVFSYTPQQRYESVAVAPAAALAVPVLEILAPGALAALGVGLYGLFQNKSLNALSLGLGSRRAGIDDQAIIWRDSRSSTSGRSGQSPVVSINSIVQTMRNAGLSPALATRTGVELRQLQGSIESRKFATNLQTSPHLLGIAMVRAMQHVHGFSDTQANSLLAQMARMSADPTKLIASINQLAMAAAKPAGQPSQPMFSAATIQRLNQMQLSQGVQAALQAVDIQVNKPAAALNTLQAQAAQYNALQQLRRSPDWPALSAHLGAELASLQTSLQKTMTALSAQATSRMEAAATLLHLGRNLTASEVNQLETIQAELKRLQSQITAAYTPLQRAGLYENPLHPTVLQIKKQVGKIWSKIGERFRGLQDRAGRTADGVGQFIPGSGGAGSRLRVAQRDAAAGKIKLGKRVADLVNSQGGTSTPQGGSPNSQPPGGGGVGKLVRIGTAVAGAGTIIGGLIWVIARQKGAERAQKISAQQSSSLVQITPVPEVVPEFRIFLDQKNQLENLDRQLVSHDVFAAGLRDTVDLSRPITQQERKKIDEIYAFLADSDKPYEQKTQKSEELKQIVFRGLSLIQSYINEPRNGSVGVKPEHLASIDIKNAPPNDLARARFLRADSYQARRALENHYNNHLLFFKMQTAAMLTLNILHSGDYTSLSQWQRIFGDSTAESPNVVTQSDWHKRVTEGQGAQAIQNSQRIAMDSFDSLVVSVTQEDQGLLGIPPDGDASTQERKAYGARLRLLADLFGRVGSNAIDSLQNASTANSGALQNQIGAQLALQSDAKDRTLNVFQEMYQPYKSGGEYSKYPTNDPSTWVSIKMGIYTFVLPFTVASNDVERRRHIRNIEDIVQKFSSNDIPLGFASEVRSKVEKKIRELRRAAPSSGEPVSQRGGSGASTGSSFTGEPLPLDSGSRGDGTYPVETD
jgi:hypothetical protein